MMIYFIDFPWRSWYYDHLLEYQDGLLLKDKRDPFLTVYNSSSEESQVRNMALTNQQENFLMVQKDWQLIWFWF